MVPNPNLDRASLALNHGQLCRDGRRHCAEVSSDDDDSPTLQAQERGRRSQGADWRHIACAGARACGIECQKRRAPSPYLNASQHERAGGHSPRPRRDSPCPIWFMARRATGADAASPSHHPAPPTRI
mmetsp:Transcript_25251/g.69550  ORF Transcript_25251/g.69550 Transcript_25251/m.69550 type:complete len:128 (-) Transcript_25251:291-674(-)